MNDCEEMNIWIDDGALHCKVFIPKETEVVLDAQGNETYAFAAIDPARLATIANGLKQAFIAAGFNWRKDAPRQYGGGGKPRPEPVKVMETNPETGVEQEVKCPQCGSDVWDNREENKKRLAADQKERPQYVCKKKEECGWYMWRPKGKVA